MRHQLLVLRHAKSDWSVDTDDYNRPLKPRGVKAAQKMGNWMKQNGYNPDIVISSAARRAKETTRLIQQSLVINSESVGFEEDLYLADKKILLTKINAISEDRQTALLVGHNPGLEELIQMLSQGHVQIPDNGKLLTTAALACFSFDKPWKKMAKHSAVLEYILKPVNIDSSVHS